MGKYLDFYEKCMETGSLPVAGLCESLGHGVIKKFMTKKELQNSVLYWGYNGATDYIGLTPESQLYIETDPHIRQNEFTPLRQNIVLLLAAMNGEL